jgi:hypothetical protein
MILLQLNLIFLRSFVLKRQFLNKDAEKIQDWNRLAVYADDADCISVSIYRKGEYQLSVHSSR